MKQLRLLIKINDYLYTHNDNTPNDTPKQKNCASKLFKKRKKLKKFGVHKTVQTLCSLLIASYYFDRLVFFF